MLTVLSPSKTLDYESPARAGRSTKPKFAKEALELVSVLREQKQDQLGSLMKLSAKLAALNYTRYQDFEEKFTKGNSKPAIDAFRGDVYKAFEDKGLTEAGYSFAQDHIRILSGLYGIIRPLDLIQPYRLEMGTSLKNPGGKDLYEFWKQTLTKSIASELKKHDVPVLLNLASKEYFSVIDSKNLGYDIVHVHFKEKRDDKLKVIALNAKRARGAMAQWIVANEVDSPEAVKKFSLTGYKFRATLSSDTDLVFVK